MGEKEMEKSYAQVISSFSSGFGHIQNLVTQKSYININCDKSSTIETIANTKSIYKRLRCTLDYCFTW
jgi:hypothetical protein